MKFIKNRDRIGKIKFNCAVENFYNDDELSFRIYKMIWYRENSPLFPYKSLDQSYIEIEFKDDETEKQNKKYLYSNELVCVEYDNENYSVYDIKFLKSLEDYMINFEEKCFNNRDEAKNYLKNFLNEQYELWKNKQIAKLK